MKIQKILAWVFLLLGAAVMQAASLKVTLAPAAAVSAGARWRVDGGSWRSSGTTATVAVGNHRIEYRVVAGWSAPASATVWVGSGTKGVTATYQRMADLGVTLLPSAGKWSVDNGATWRASGAVVPLASGNYTLSYQAPAGYQPLASEGVSLVAGAVVNLSRAFAEQPASVTVNLTPEAGQWSVDNGMTWRASASAVLLASGAYTLSYRAPSGYQPLASEALTVSRGQSITLSRTFAAAMAAVSVVCGPSWAPAGVVGWSVDGGATWHGSGETATVAAGAGTVVFRAAAGWRSPEAVPYVADAGATLALESGRPYQPTHRLKFFLAPELAGKYSAEELADRLGQYVDILNLIWEREAGRHFDWDAASGIVISAANPFSGSHYGTFPELGFEMWAYVQLSTNPTFPTYGGRASFDVSGAGGGDGFFWSEIYDPSALQPGTDSLRWFWTQIDHLLHEFEHTHGAGTGEYYSCTTLNDPTGVAPILNESPWSTPGEEYTAAHMSWFYDPLKGLLYGNSLAGNIQDLPGLVEAVRFAPPTRGIMAGLHRGDGLRSDVLPDMDAVRVEIRDALTGALVPGATLRVFNRWTPGATSSGREEVVTATAVDGVFSLDWSPYAEVQNNYDNAKILKGYAPGYTPRAHWVCVYDGMTRKLVHGEDTWTIVLYLTPAP